MIEHTHLVDPALREFRESMCSEHLDEAAALHDIARAIRLDTIADWADAGPFEERMDAHLDALVVGGEAADTVCDAALVAADDAGTCHAAAAVLARRGDKLRVQSLASRLASMPVDGACARGIAEAWLHDLPAALGTLLPVALRAHDVPGDGRCALWEVMGGRRWDSQGLLSEELDLIKRSPLSIDAQGVGLLRAAGRCADRLPADAAGFAYAHPADATRLTALISGIRRRDPVAVRVLDDAAAGKGVTGAPAVPPILLAMAGGATAVRTLVSLLDSESSVAVVDALGVYGSLASVRPLMACLADKLLGPAAAQALYLISGLRLLETTRLTDEVDEDTLFDRERVRWQRDGTAPKAGDGLPYGRTVQRLSLDAAVWREALHARSAQFSAGTRYRFGTPYTLQSLFNGLSRPGVSWPLREAFIEEAMLRHGVDLRLDGMPSVRRQQAMLTSSTLATVAAADASPAGRWCRDGREPS